MWLGRVVDGVVDEGRMGSLASRRSDTERGLDWIGCGVTKR